MKQISVKNLFTYDGVKVTNNWLFKKTVFPADEITSISVYPPPLVNRRIKDLVKKWRQGVALCFTLKNGKESVTNSVNIIIFNHYYLKQLRDFLIKITQDYPSIFLDPFIKDLIETEL